MMEAPPPPALTTSGSGGSNPTQTGTPKPQVYFWPTLYIDEVTGNIGLVRLWNPATGQSSEFALNTAFPTAHSALISLRQNDADTIINIELTAVPTTTVLNFVPDPSKAPTNAQDLRAKAIIENSLSQIIAGLAQELPEQSPPLDPTTQRRYFRVKRQEIDTNGNGIFDSFEIAYGGWSSVFAPLGSAEYLDPLGDKDNDGFTNREEALSGTSLDDKEDHPPSVTYLVVARRSTKFQNTSSPDDYVASTKGNWESDHDDHVDQWSTPGGMNDYLADGLPTSPFDPRLDGVSGDPSDGGALGGNIELEGTFTDLGDSEFKGEGEKVRCWLVHKPKLDQSISRAFIINRFTSHGETQDLPLAEFEPISMTVEAGQTFSDPYDLTLEFPEPSGTNSTLGAKTRMRPIQVVMPVEETPGAEIPVALSIGDPTLVNKNYRLMPDCPAIAKMEASLGANDALLPENDADSFRVLIKDLKGEETISVKLKTTKADGADLDQLVKLTMSYNNNQKYYVSKPNVMVSDKVDDETIVGGKGDGAEDDPTHRLELDGSLKLESITINGVEKNLNGKMVLAHRREINLIVGVASDVTATAERIQTDVDVAVERFAQLGIKIKYNKQPIHFDMPTGVGSRISELDPGNSPTENTVNFLTTFLNKRSPMDAELANRTYYCMYVKEITYKDKPQNDAAQSMGLAFINSSPTYGSRYLRCFCVAETHRKFTFAHELGHTLTKNGHYGVGYALYPVLWASHHNLMQGQTSDTDEIGSTKRMYKLQEEMIFPKKSTK